ncbi:DUF6417 family protein [Streptomyces galbus]|uniref:DUF6417 family protein n=1 Tax=Streptomyces galbus TaxID=33898 RepID=UPI0019832884|nr:DUF6417 family protein [Streptomyces galbus]GHD52565.1 hypothetical protein GCM10010335_65280 [Streptomyces galbus]
MKQAAVLELLDVLEERQEASGHGWVLDLDGVPREGVLKAAASGLAELAERDDRAELSARVGRPVRWAARLTDQGRDLLLYARSQPAAGPAAPGPEYRLVELMPSQMDVVRVFTGLADRLQVPPAPGLDARVYAAVQDRVSGRWRLYLTEEQTASVAYGLWLHKMAGSAAEANRFSRDHGIAHIPAT